MWTVQRWRSRQPACSIMSMPDTAVIALAVAVLIGLITVAYRLHQKCLREREHAAGLQELLTLLIAAGDVPPRLELVGPPPDHSGINWLRQHIPARRIGSVVGVAAVIGFVTLVALLTNHGPAPQDQAAPDPLPPASQPNRPGETPSTTPSTPSTPSPPSSPSTTTPAGHSEHYVGNPSSTSRSRRATSSSTTTSSPTPAPSSTSEPLLCHLPCGLIGMLVAP